MPSVAWSLPPGLWAESCTNGTSVTFFSKTNFSIHSHTPSKNVGTVLFFCSFVHSFFFSL